MDWDSPERNPPQNSKFNESFETNPSIQGRELNLKTQTSNRFNILLDAERSDGDESAGMYQKPTSGADMSASDVGGVMQGVGSTELMHGEAPSHTSAVLDNSYVPDSNELFTTLSETGEESELQRPQYPRVTNNPPNLTSANSIATTPTSSTVVVDAQRYLFSDTVQDPA